MLARGLEFTPDQLEVEQEEPEVLAGFSGIEAALAAGCGATVERLGGDCLNKLDVGLDLAGVERRLEPARLDRTPVPRSAGSGRGNWCCRSAAVGSYDSRTKCD